MTSADQLFFFVSRLKKLIWFITPHEDFRSPHVEAISNPNKNIGTIQKDWATLLASKLPYLKYITAEQNKIVKLHRSADDDAPSLEPVQPGSIDWHEAKGTKYFQLKSSQEILCTAQKHCIRINKHIQQQKRQDLRREQRLTHNHGHSLEGYGKPGPT